MKKIVMFVLAMLTLGMNANARTLLECTTVGDALSSVQVIETSRGPAIRVIDLDNSVTQYKIMMGDLTKIRNGRSDTLIGAKNPDQVFGGAIMDAALMRVFPGQKEAYLSANKSVYILNCRK